MESFFESIVSPSLKWAHRVGSSSEETSSSNEESSVDEEEESPSSLPLIFRFFDVTMDSSTSSSSQ
jgi:hypothetical protein